MQPKEITDHHFFKLLKGVCQYGNNLLQSQAASRFFCARFACMRCYQFRAWDSHVPQNDEKKLSDISINANALKEL